MAKNIKRFLEKLYEYYFLNIIVNVNFFSDLKFEYYCEYFPEILPQVSLVFSLIIANSSSSNNDFFASSSVTLEGRPWISFWTGQLSSGCRRLIKKSFIKLCLVFKTAGLTSPGTKHQHSIPTNDRIFVTLFSTLYFHSFLNPLI